jgi:hypothetical protein
MGCLIHSVLAGEMRDIELTDGSVLSAEVLALQDGVYTLRSSTLGTITIAAAKVKVIRSQEPTPPAAPAPPAASLTQQLMNNPEIMGMVLSLQENPAMQALLADPAVLDAINKGDFNALLANPRFLELLNDPTVHDITKKATGQ